MEFQNLYSAIWMRTQRIEQWWANKFAELAEQENQPTTVTFALPGAPPTGSHVASPNGGVFRRIAINSVYAEDMYGQWGAWVKVDKIGAYLGIPESWATLLLREGPLTLMPPTEAETAQAQIYGEPHARWGTPDQPCDFIDCTMGEGHVGPHIELDGKPLGENDTIAETEPTNTTPHEASKEPCTCGRPDRHRAGCPRYVRLRKGRK